MGKLKAGIIGCGGIAFQKHMPSLKNNSDLVDMVAFCDIIPEQAEKAAQQFGTEDAKTYTDYKQMLEDSSIDIIHVLTPNLQHSFITVDALEAGKHVMCEKPMAINSAEARKMLDAAERTGKKLTSATKTVGMMIPKRCIKLAGKARSARCIWRKPMRSAGGRFRHGAYLPIRSSKVAAA